MLSAPKYGWVRLSTGTCRGQGSLPSGEITPKSHPHVDEVRSKGGGWARAGAGGGGCSASIGRPMLPRSRNEASCADLASDLSRKVIASDKAKERSESPRTRDRNRES